MDPKTFDRQSQGVYLVLVIVGLVLAAAAWMGLIF
jgi:hypothetical protein